MKCFLRAQRSHTASAAAALLAVITALLGVSCDGGQSGAEVAAGGSGGDPVPGTECQTDDICRRSALEQLGFVAAPQPYSFAVHSSSCQPHGVQLEDRAVSGFACGCILAETIAPQGAPLQSVYVLGPTGVGCSVTGRGGDCLWSDDDVASCTGMIDFDACDAPCAELAERLTSDAARSFQTELVYAGCEQGTCKNVISIDGQCYASFPASIPEQPEKSYDCALGAEAILQADAAAWKPRALIGPPRDGAPYYEPSSSATVRLSVSQDYWGTARGPLGFGVSAQFYDKVVADVRYGDVLDPLDGSRDCGIWRQSPNGAGPSPRLLSVDRAVLRYGDREFALRELHPNSDSYSYQFDLASAGVEPHFNDRGYGFSASGGSFGASVEIPSISLPELVSSPELERNSHFEHGALALTWKSGGANALQISLDIKPRLDDDKGAYHIECLPPDGDGAFSVPAAVLEAVPDGFVTATLRRTYNTVGSVHTVGEAVTNYHFALGPRCDGSALMAACQRSANTIRARYQECSDVEPPPLEQLCPDYLATTCDSCPGYFDCLAASTTCESTGLAMPIGCGCPE